MRCARSWPSPACRGPVGSFLFLNLWLLNHPTLENATGVGAPPWTWPVDEQVIDLVHKAIYAYATGAVADRLVERPAGQERAKGGHYYRSERDRLLAASSQD